MSPQPGPPNLPSRAASLFRDPGRPSIYDNTGGLVLADFVAHNLGLIPPIAENAVIHDNACGPGTVTKHILASANQRLNPTIYATDIDQEFLDAFTADIRKGNKKYPVEISNQRSENLGFEDGMFDLSVMNMGIFFTSSNGLDGAKEIYRTLKPNSTAIVNCWENITWLSPILAAHSLTRPDIPFPRQAVSWSDGTHLKSIMIQAGFDESKMRIDKSVAWAKTRDLRDWAENAWAFLGGMGGWHEGDDENWDLAVDRIVEGCMASEETMVMEGQVWMKASQWVVIARK